MRRMLKEVIYGVFCLSMITCENEIFQILNESLNMDVFGKFLNQSFIKDILNFQNNSVPSSFRIVDLKKHNSLSTFSTECKTTILDLVSPFINQSKSEIIKRLFIYPLGKYVDALPKPQGILQGNLKWLGSYDECNDIGGAKYCLAQMQIASFPFPGQTGVCVPKQCTVEDIFTILSLATLYTQNSIVFAKPIFCDSPVKYNTGAIISLVICGLLLILCCIGTSLGRLPKNHFSPVTDIDKQDKELLINPVGYHAPHNENNVKTIFSCFSILKNIPAILSTESPRGAVESLNGIRVLSLTWVILGHMYFAPIATQLFDNPSSLVKVVHNFSFMVVGGAYVAVDSFFMLSGFLVTYLSMRRMDSNNGRLPLLKFYIHRYIRLTPVYGFVILIWNNLFPLTVTGPYASQIRYGDAFQNPCNKYWWSNLLYINNFYPTDMMQQCLGWSWYLANDMQFYIISPAILYTAYWLDKKYAGKPNQYFLVFLFFGALTSISLLTTGLIIGINNYPSLLTALYLPNNPRSTEATEVQNKVYEKPYTRFSAYVIGMLLGYIISRNVSVKEKYKKIFFFLGWVLFIATGLAIIYGPWHVFKPNGFFFNDAEDVIYGTFHRVAWSCAVAWVVYACHNNAGGLINKFLSWRLWIPFSRLSYNAYLIHLVVIIYFYDVQENEAHYQTNMMVFNFVSVLVISYVFAFVLALCVEYPVFNLEKMIFK